MVPKDERENRSKNKNVAETFEWMGMHMNVSFQGYSYTDSIFEKQD